MGSLIKKHKAGDKAIHYNENAEAYARSGKPAPAAERAKKALDDKREAAALKRAEQAGKRPPQRRSARP
jgi:hypothetical protein